MPTRERGAETSVGIPPLIRDTVRVLSDERGLCRLLEERPLPFLSQFGGIAFLARPAAGEPLRQPDTSERSAYTDQSDHERYVHRR